MHAAARLLIATAGLLIAASGLFDLFTPRLPPNLAAICASQPSSERLARELLRALGGALLGIGLSVLSIAAAAPSPFSINQLLLVILLVFPAEGVNALAMHRMGSLWKFPASFLGITVAGILFALAR